GEFENRALATGTPPQGDDVTDESDNNSYTEDDSTIVPICQTPAIAIVKTSSYDDGGDCSQPGEEINYTFTVTNEGNVSLENVTVTDPLIATISGPTGDTDGDGELDVTEEWEYTGTYVITQTDIDNGSVTNTATAEGTAPDGTVVTDDSGSTVDNDDPTETELCQTPAIAIVKTSSYDDGGDCSQPGEEINYTFTVTNEGNVSLENVTVTDPLIATISGPTGDTDGDGELDVTEEWEYTGTYVITQEDIDNGSVTNTATAEGTAPDGTVVTDDSGSTVDNDDPTETELCQTPAIAIVKTSSYDDGGDCSQPGEEINYTFTVTNEGNVSLENVTVTDPLIATISGPTGDTDGDGELDVTEEWEYTGTYVITQEDIDKGEVINQATAGGAAPDGTVVTDESGLTITDNDPTITELCQDPAIAIVKTGIFNDEDQDGCSNVGETISYTFSVTNQGNVSLSFVSVIDPLLGGTITGPDSGDTDGDGKLDVTEEWIYTANYAITQADIDTGEVVNQATAKGEAPSGDTVTDDSGATISDDDPTVTVLCQNADIAVVKTGIFNDEDGDGCSNVGETISYTFSVTNEGNVSLANVTVADPLITTINGPTGDTDGDGDLDVTETWIYNGDYTITQADIDAGQVVNQAMAEGTDPDGTIVTDDSGATISDDDPTVTVLCQNADIAIVKTGIFNDEDGDGCSNVGETISYTFSVTNEGNVSIVNVTITDPLIATINGPTGDTDGDGELDVTETWIYNGDYTITQGDINTGQVVNQATAEGTAPDGSILTDDSGATINDDDPTVTILCQNGAIALVKIGTLSDENGDGCTQVGETIVYDFIVTNTGIVDLTNVTVTDPLVTVSGGPISLASGATDATTFTAVYTVTQADIDAGQVVNQATAEGTTPAGDIVMDDSGATINDDDATVTTLCQTSSMSLEKSGVFNDENGDGIPQIGETISYTFSVTNTGTITLYNITIDDPLPGIDIQGGPIASLDPGVTDNTTFTGTYSINDADIEAGEVINQAIVTGEDYEGTVVTDESDDPNNDDDIDNNGDGEPDDPTVTVLPNVDPEGDFEIFNGITPNGDNLNDYFVIAGIQDYSQNNVKIYNRWGVLVWETDGYGGSNGMENVFEGESNGRSTIRANEELPTGTYFYILSFPSDNPGKASYSGYLYINR
ncbi:gliding motility-associated C-terminal domain-containing protein, partial [Marixanthomonas ophiurae]